MAADAEQALPIGRVAGHRGSTGAMTVRVGAGDAEFWVGISDVLIGDGDDTRTYRVERSQAYRDRLVLKLAGVDDPSAAEALRGRPVRAAVEKAPTLPAGRHYVAQLVGLDVFEQGTRLGPVLDVVPGAGQHMLIVGRAAGELLIPFVEAIVTAVDEDRGRIEVRLPPGLLGLNQPGSDGEDDEL